MLFSTTASNDPGVAIDATAVEVEVMIPVEVVTLVLYGAEFLLSVIVIVIVEVRGGKVVVDVRVVAIVVAGALAETSCISAKAA